ncbi:MAG: translocation/assembly module TamB domain-containing protein [Candidatus Cryptobacteroides sp.]
MAKKVLTSLEDKIDGRIVVGGLSANPFKAVVLKDVAILDNNPWRDPATGYVACDTLFRAKYITASFGLKSLLGGLLGGKEKEAGDGAGNGSGSTATAGGILSRNNAKGSGTGNESGAAAETRAGGNVAESGSQSGNRAETATGGGIKIRTVKITGAMMYLSIEPGVRPAGIASDNAAGNSATVIKSNATSNATSDATSTATAATSQATAPDTIPNNNNLKRIFRLKKKTEIKEKSTKEVFSIGSVKIQDMSFVMENFTKDKSKFENGINWFDMEVTGINISGRNLKMKGPVMSGKCDSLSFREKSGYICQKISGKAEVGNGRMDVRNFRLLDAWSNIDIPELVMTYRDTDAWSEFVTDVRMDGNIRKSTVSLNTLRYFAPSLAGRSMEAEVEGHVEGYVADLGIDGIRFRTTSKAGSGISGTVTGSLRGLPDTEKMVIDGNVTDARMTSAGLSNFIRGWSPNSSIDLGKFCKGDTLSFSGKMLGRLNSFTADGDIRLKSGSATTSLKINNLVNKYRPMEIEGTIGTTDIDISRVIGGGPVGECSLRTGCKATLGRDSTGITIDSLFVDRLRFNGYDYSGLAAAGTFLGNTFDGRIVCSDPNLNFLFQGIFTFSSKTRNAIYKFYANLGYADLHALNFDKREISRVSLKTQANFTRISGEDIVGDIGVRDIRLVDEHGEHEVGDISIASLSGNDISRIKFTSKFADATYSGSRFITGFVKDIQAITTRKSMPSLYLNDGGQWENDRYDLSVNFHDSRDVLSFFAPGAYIADSTTLKVSVGQDGDLKARLKSGRLAYHNKYLKGMNVLIDNPDASLRARISSEEISVSPLLMRNADLFLAAVNDSVKVRYAYDNKDRTRTGKENRGHLRLDGNLFRDEARKAGIRLSILPSSIVLDSEEWGIVSREIMYCGDKARIPGLKLSSPGQDISIDGGWAANASDTLNLALNRFDLSLLNNFTGQDFGIRGRATGKAMLISPTSGRAGILLNLLSDSTEFAGRPVGTLRLASVWEDAIGKFNVVCRNDIGGARTLDAIGDYYPDTKKISGKVIANGLDAGYLTPFLNSVFSNVSGTASGRLDIGGLLSKPEFSGDGLRIDNAKLTVNFTGVEYNASGPVDFSSSGIMFNGVKINDRYGAGGNVEGGIKWRNFKDMEFGIHLNFKDILALDTKEEDNSTFYGNIFATGNLDITGPVTSILLSADATTAKTGALHIPIGGSASATVSNLLTFKEPEKITVIDPYEELMKNLNTKEARKSDLGIRLRVRATPEVEADIELDKAAGNVLNGRGSGLIDLDIRPSSGVFKINGGYDITDGIFHFVALGIAKRDFNIEEGSSIRFNGDIMDSDLDIDATYRTKASVGTLIADTTATTTRRTVECKISISDKLRNPRLGFGIEIPDLDPTTQARVESALNTQDKVQKQLLTLLITNSFLPDEQSGVTNRTSSTLYSNVTEIMAGQLNNILQKLNIPVDFGLDYQQNMSGTDIFDVALSTALFNNRVIVNGTVGNRQYDTESSGSEFVGDLDIDVKLTKSGALRLNLFSHSADQYTNYLDNSQRNGLGFSYQKEYDRPKDIFKYMFKGRRKRQEAEAARQAELQRQDKKTITILPGEDRKKKRK